MLLFCFFFWHLKKNISKNKELLAGVKILAKSIGTVSHAVGHCPLNAGDAISVCHFTSETCLMLRTLKKNRTPTLEFRRPCGVVCSVCAMCNSVCVCVSV